ncbi:MAG: C-terminal binding protein [Opitutales bacterium]|nr:C-terminal binding protein [Opitutales bacterium]
MVQSKIVVTDHGFQDVLIEKKILSAAACKFEVYQCRTEEEVLNVLADPDVILVQYAPITRKVIESLDRCRAIIRYGMGVDNIDVEAAQAKGIAVCNIPDYGIQEVADHTAAMCLALSRQLIHYTHSVRAGDWPDSPIVRPQKSLRSVVFATAGLGRIAREVHRRMQAFGVKSVAYDPYLSASQFETLGIQSVTKDQLIETSDIIALHLPLTDETRGFIGTAEFSRMKKGSILVNTARGGLVDTLSLVQALEEGLLGGAALDVFAEEPLTPDHPIRRSPRVMLSPHLAWFSEDALPTLQRLAGEEALRAVRREPLRCCINPEVLA